MPDFSLVSPITWEETLLDSIISATSLDNESRAKTLTEFLLERQAGISDIRVDFRYTEPKTTKEKLLYALVNNTTFTGSPKNRLETFLYQKLNMIDIDETTARSYLEYLYAYVVESNLIESNPLRAYSFPLPDNYLTALFWDDEVRNLTQFSSNFSKWTNQSATLTADTHFIDGIRFSKVEDANASVNADIYLDINGMLNNAKPVMVSCYILKDASYVNSPFILRMLAQGGASVDRIDFIIDPADLENQAIAAANDAVLISNGYEDFGAYARIWFKGYFPSTDNTSIRVFLYPGLKSANDPNSATDVANTGYAYVGGVCVKYVDTPDDRYVNTHGAQHIIDASPQRRDGFRGGTSNSAIVWDGDRYRYRTFANTGNGMEVTSNVGLINLTNFWGWVELKGYGTSNSHDLITVFKSATDANFIFRIDATDHKLRLVVYDSANTGHGQIESGTTKLSQNNYKGFVGFEYKNNVGGNAQVKFYYKLNLTDEWELIETLTEATYTLKTSTALFRLNCRATNYAGAGNVSFYRAKYGSGDFESTTLFELNLDTDCVHAGQTKILSASGHTVLVVQTDGTDSADGTRTGLGLSQDGVDDYVRVSQAIPDADFTATILVKFGANAWALSNVIFGSRLGVNDCACELRTTGTDNVQLLFKTATDPNSQINLNLTLVANTWYVITAKREGSTLYLYRNGVLGNSNSLTRTSAVGSSGQTVIGARDYNKSNPAQQTPAGFWTHSVALTNEQIAQQYQAIKDYLTAVNKLDILADLP